MIKKISIMTLRLIFITQSAVYLQAPPAESVKPINQPKEQAPQPKSEIGAEQSHDTQTPSSKTSETSSSSKSTEPTGEINLSPESSNKETENFTGVLIEKGAESDVDRSQEKVKDETEENKKKEAEQISNKMSDDEAAQLEATIETITKELENDSSNSAEILAKAAEKMGIKSLSLETQNLIMQNLKTDWNTLASQYKNSSIPTDKIKDFLHTMDTTIKTAK